MLNVDLPGAVLGFVGVHLGLRSEVGAIERAVDDGDIDAARRRARLLRRVLYNHHHAEDHVLFPAVRERHPGAATTTAELEEQHVELDRALDELAADVTRIETAGRLIERHLIAEEQQVLPLWLAGFSAAEHERFAYRLRRATPLREAGLMISWLLDVSPDGSTEIAWAQVPRSLQLLHRVWWKRGYERTFGHLDRPATLPTSLPFAGVPLAAAA